MSQFWDTYTTDCNDCKSYEREMRGLRMLLSESQNREGELRAARIAYASEFDGDTGNIHASIRALKGECARLREELYVLTLPCAGYTAEENAAVKKDLATKDSGQ